jgi:hypothetical protein
VEILTQDLLNTNNTANCYVPAFAARHHHWQFSLYAVTVLSGSYIHLVVVIVVAVVVVVVVVVAVVVVEIAGFVEPGSLGGSGGGELVMQQLPSSGQ